jgi:type VI secretion system protein ImpK
MLSGSGEGLNPLVACAAPLLVLAGRLRNSRQAADVPGLRRQALEEIRRFEERAARAGVANEQVVAARYVLCATLDEAVLATPWGGQSEWSQHTLLVTLHGEAWGGEKFFDMLTRTWDQPARFIDLMELQYLCLSMGFAGRFQVQRDGPAQLAQIQHQLFQRIRAHRGSAPAELSPHWAGEQDKRNPLLEWVPWWVALAAALLLVFGAFAWFHLRLGAAAAPVEAKLAAIGLDTFRAPAAGPKQGPTLRELLAADAAGGVLQVEDIDGKSQVTLLAPDLFESASARVNQDYYEVIAHVARALNEVPGRVLVVGHTDDQPVRSLRYRDNFELSRQRALAVVELMKVVIANPARVEWSGLGSTQPRYTPASLPENRKRNRRVEIVLVPGGAP